MGLRSPAELASKAPDVAQMPNSRFQAVQREQIGNEYLKSISSGINAVEKAQLDQQKKMASIVKARYRAEANKARLSQENSVAMTEGWDALKSSQKAGGSLDKETRSLMGKYGDQYQGELETVRMEVLNQFTRTTQPYVVNQTKTATKKTFDAVIADTMNDAVLSSANLEEFDGLLNSVGGIVREKSNVQYGYDEEAEVMPGMKLKQLIDSESQIAKSRTVRNSVGILVDGNQYSKAIEVFDKYKGTMNADDLQSAMKDLSKGLEKQDDVVSASMARDLYLKHGNNILDAREEALALASNTKQYEKIVRNFDDLVDSKQKQEKIEAETQTKKVYDLYDEGASWQSLQSELDKLPPKQKSEIIEAYNKNGKSLYPNVTNDRKMSEAMDRVMSDFSGIEREEKQGGNFLVKYRTQLNPQDFQTISRMYQSKKKAGSDAQARMENSYDKMAMEASIAVNNELNIASPDIIAKSKRLAVEIAQDLVAKNPRMKDSEFNREVRTRLFRQINAPEVKQRSRFSPVRAWKSFRGEADADFYIESGDENNPNVPASPMTNNEKYTPEYLNNTREQYRQKLKDSGRNFTDQQLNDLINLRIREGKL